MTDHDTSSTPATQSVVLEREFDAPIESVWTMWADADHFAAWYGPQGASIPLAEMDTRVGGRRRICMEMTTPDGSMQMWFVGEFLTVEAPTLLVYTESMADPDGNVLDPAAAGMPADHPAVTEVRVELTDLGGRTALTLTHAGVPADSPGAMGWTMALDKLSSFLAG
ncbi:MAG: SRPBCC domain-containing protein [Actinomycetota bacterium]